MNKLILILLTCQLAATKKPLKALKNTVTDAAGDIFDLIPGSNFALDLVNASVVKAEEALGLKTKFRVYFGLYTSNNPKDPQKLFKGNLESIRNSSFNPTLPTRVICHGWRNTNKSQINISIRNRYLKRGDFNVIVVDWSEAANTVNYIRSAVSTRAAGKKVASFINFLIRNASLDANNTYLIGHSLGAHVVGVAGRRIHPKVNTIFGLDVAKPLFTYILRNRRLAKGDAHYVETIHTDGGALGFMRPIGNASFYPDFGYKQPGCSDLTTSCDHSRSWKYFSESLLTPNKFNSKKCKMFKQLIKMRCQGVGAFAKMGGEPSNYDQGVKGEYFTPVNSGYPFATGTLQ